MARHRARRHHRRAHRRPRRRSWRSRLSKMLGGIIARHRLIGIAGAAAGGASSSLGSMAAASAGIGAASAHRRRIIVSASAAAGGGGIGSMAAYRKLDASWHLAHLIAALPASSSSRRRAAHQQRLARRRRIASASARKRMAHRASSARRLALGGGAAAAAQRPVSASRHQWRAHRRLARQSAQWRHRARKAQLNGNSLNLGAHASRSALGSIGGGGGIAWRRQRIALAAIVSRRWRGSGSSLISVSSSCLGGGIVASLIGISRSAAWRPRHRRSVIA